MWHTQNQVSVSVSVHSEHEIINFYLYSAVKDLHWDRPLQIIKYPDPRLRAVNARIGTFDSKVEQLGKELLEVMYNG